jgi:hypothetical protein
MSEPDRICLSFDPVSIRVTTGHRVPFAQAAVAAADGKGKLGSGFAKPLLSLKFLESDTGDAEAFGAEPLSAPSL